MFVTAVLGGLLSAGPASAAVLPIQAEILTSPSPVSWPDSPGFEYRINFRAGPDGADFQFSTDGPDWGFADTLGTPFVIGLSTLDGPGTLSPVSLSIADLSPFSCWRGGRQGDQIIYGLKLAPYTSTTVVVGAQLAAAPLAGMNTGTRLTIFGGDTLTAAPPNIEGPDGVRIVTRVNGQKGLRPVKRSRGDKFVLSGYTRPALPNRKIVITAYSINFAKQDGFDHDPVKFKPIQTDSRGHFRSKSLGIKGPAYWLMKASLLRAGKFATESSCGPYLDYSFTRPSD